MSPASLFFLVVGALGRCGVLGAPATPTNSVSRFAYRARALAI